MPKLVGIFSYFKDLDKVSPADISSWLRFKGDIHILANFIGNRIIYSQTVPINKLDLDIDMAILREVIKKTPEYFYLKKEDKIIISKDLKERFPPLSKLVTIIIETINPKGLITIHLKEGNNYQFLGTLIAPENIEGLFKGKQSVSVVVNGVATQLLKNSLSISGVNKVTLQIKIGDSKEISVNGGQLGIVIDLRDKPQVTNNE